MTQTTPELSQLNEQFKTNFALIAPLILEEWQNLDLAKLEATEGDFDQVVDYIAIATDHTHVLIRRQLQELSQIAMQQHAPAKPTPLTNGLNQFVSEHITDLHLKHTIAQLEERTEKLLHQFKQEIMPELSEKVQKKPVESLLTALGIGFVLGVLLGGKRGR